MLRIRLLLVGLFVMFAVSAITSASASATTQRWFVKGEELASGKVEKVVSKGTEKFILKSTALALTVKIECTTEKSKGTIENPSGGGAGKGTDVIEFSGCTVPEPAGEGCKITEPIKAEASMELVEFSEKAADEFKPKTTNFTELVFTGCSSTELDKTYPIKGTDTGIALNTTSELEFTNTSGNLTYGGEPAKLKGKSELELESGGGVQIGPPVAIFKGPSWVTEGGRLEAGEERTVSVSGGIFKFRTASGEVKIECSGVSGNGDIIGSAKEKVGTDKYSKIEFTGCADKAEKGCEIVSFANGEKEERPAGKIGPVSVGTELVFPGNTVNRTNAGDLLLPLEENTEGRFGAGAPEKVFVVLELRKKGAEVCTPNGKRFSLPAALAGGPAAELKIAKKAAKAGERAESVELSFPSTQYTHAEKWIGSAYKVEPIEFQWINESKTLQTLEIEGTLTMTMTGKTFGWAAS